MCIRDRRERERVILPGLIKYVADYNAYMYNESEISYCALKLEVFHVINFHALYVLSETINMSKLCSMR